MDVICDLTRGIRQGVARTLGPRYRDLREDAEQEAWLKILKFLKDDSVLRNPFSFGWQAGTWSALAQMEDERRHAPTAPAPPSGAEEGSLEAPDVSDEGREARATVENVEVRQIISQIRHRLTKRQHIIFSHVLLGFKQVEIADRMDILKSTVCMELSSIRRVLEALLFPPDDNPPSPSGTRPGGRRRRKDSRAMDLKEGSVMAKKKDTNLLNVYIPKSSIKTFLGLTLQLPAFAESQAGAAAGPKNLQDILLRLGVIDDKESTMQGAAKEPATAGAGAGGAGAGAGSLLPLAPILPEIRHWIHFAAYGHYNPGKILALRRGPVEPLKPLLRELPFELLVGPSAQVDTTAAAEVAADAGGEWIQRKSTSYGSFGTAVLRVPAPGLIDYCSRAVWSILQASFVAAIPSDPISALDPVFYGVTESDRPGVRTVRVSDFGKEEPDLHRLFVKRVRLLAAAEIDHGIESGRFLAIFRHGHRPGERPTPDGGIELREEQLQPDRNAAGHPAVAAGIVNLILAAVAGVRPKERPGLLVWAEHEINTWAPKNRIPVCEELRAVGLRNCTAYWEEEFCYIGPLTIDRGYTIDQLVDPGLDELASLRFLVDVGEGVEFAAQRYAVLSLRDQISGQQPLDHTVEIALAGYEDIQALDPPEQVVSIEELKRQAARRAMERVARCFFTRLADAALLRARDREFADLEREHRWFLDSLSVVHFAGHAVANSDALSRSLLLLARSASHSGALTTEELLSRLELEKTRLVILSACSSAGGGPIEHGLHRAHLLRRLDRVRAEHRQLPAEQSIDLSHERRLIYLGEQIWRIAQAEALKHYDESREPDIGERRRKVFLAAIGEEALCGTSETSSVSEIPN